MKNCVQCGAELSGDMQVCAACSHENSEATSVSKVAAGLIGYSERIDDPAFRKYIKNTNRWSSIIALVLAVLAIVGFYVYGETGSEIKNPLALFIGIVLACLFLIVGFVQFVRKARSKTWDGLVVDKTAKKKSRRRNTGDNDYYYEDYTEYVVVVQSKEGKKHKIVAEDNTRYYNYFEIGDQVRHHAGLNSYEKYDKSKDQDILCNACSEICSINDEVCPRCKCPLLK